MFPATASQNARVPVHLALACMLNISKVAASLSHIKTSKCMNNELQIIFCAQFDQLQSCCIYIYAVMSKGNSISNLLSCSTGDISNGQPFLQTLWSMFIVCSTITSIIMALPLCDLVPSGLAVTGG